MLLRMRFLDCASLRGGWLLNGMALNMPSECAPGLDLLFHLMYVCCGVTIRLDPPMPRLDRLVFVGIGNP